MVLVLVLLIVRFSAPSFMTWYANQTIKRTDAIVGSVADVDLGILDGGYTIHGINIRQAGDKKDFPLIVADKIEISIFWRALLKGRLVTEISIVNPTIGLYDRPQDKVIENQAIINEKTWLGLARELTPFDIDKLTIINGSIAIDAEAQLKRTEFSIDNIQMLVTDIVISKNSATLAKAQLSGDIQNQAKVTLTAEFDPNTSKPTFDVNLEMAKLPVSYFKSLMEFYAPFDFEAGEIDLACELKSQAGEVEGYIQIGFYELDVFSWREDIINDDANPLRPIFDAIGGVLVSVLEKGDRNLLATRVDIKGSLDNPKISIIDAFAAMLRNAFIETYDLKLEHSVIGLNEQPNSSPKE